jgi:hypothetical protein
MKNLFYFSLTNSSQVSKGNYTFGLLSVLLLSTGLFLFQIYPGYLLTDGGIFTAIAFKVQKGGTLYLDAWENKPPGLFYLLILFYSLFPSKIWATFILVYLVTLLAALYTYKFYVLKLNSVILSVLLSLLTLVFLLLPNNFGDGLYTEFYGTVTVIITLYLNAKFEKDKHVLDLRLSMLMMGLSFWFKEPFILMAVLLLIYQFVKVKSIKERGVMFLFFMLPSFFFLVLLAVNHSLIPFIQTLKYNFAYTNEKTAIPFIQKWNDINSNFIQLLPIMSIAFLFYFYSNLQQKENRLAVLFWLVFLGASGSILIMSPYNFGHYYLPLFTLFFFVLVQLYTLKEEQNKSNLIFTIVVLISLYQTDKKLNPQFEFSIRKYQEDAITRHLSKQINKTLFVDCVEYGSYYIKTNLLYNTFLPVALPVHFSDNEQGIENKKRIWKELSGQPSDYLIRNYTTGFYYWDLPHNGFYDKHYELIDSAIQFNNNTLYLYRYKK